jgi:sporulation-control protein spo0M
MVGHLSVNAQTTDDVTQNINKVKRDNMYIYAEATMKNLNEAYRYIIKSIIKVKSNTNS